MAARPAEDSETSDCLLEEVPADENDWRTLGASDLTVTRDSGGKASGSAFSADAPALANNIPVSILGVDSE